MYFVVIFFHVAACLVLIMVILLQAGRGGGFSEMFSGALQQNQKIFGTETNTFLTRATAYCAVMFVITSVTLGIMTTHRSKSLMQKQGLNSLLDDLGRQAPAGKTQTALPLELPSEAAVQAEAVPAAPPEAPAPQGEQPSALAVPAAAPAQVPPQPQTEGEAPRPDAQTTGASAEPAST